MFSIPGMKHLERCVQSVQWADDIVVVKIGDAAAAHQRRTDWVLHLWGEELIEGELQEELLALRARPLSELRPSYKIAVRSYVLGRWVDGSLWGPSPSLRLIREIRSWPPSWWNARGSHEAAASLSGTIRDDSTAELAFSVSQMNRIGSLWAEASDGEVPSLGRTNFFSLRLFAAPCCQSRIAARRFCRINLVSSHGLRRAPLRRQILGESAANLRSNGCQRNQ